MRIGRGYIVAWITLAVYKVEEYKLQGTMQMSEGVLIVRLTDPSTDTVAHASLLCKLVR